MYAKKPLACVRVRLGLPAASGRQRERTWAFLLILPILLLRARNGTRRKTGAEPYSPKCVEWGFSEVELPIYGVLGSSGASLVFWRVLCHSAHTFPSHRSTLRLLRGRWTPREGSGQHPGSLLHTRASSPSTHRHHRQEAPTDLPKKRADQTYD